MQELVNDVPYYDKNKKRQPFSKEVRMEILNKYNNSCGLCPSDEGHIAHHIHPQGEPTVENGIVLCDACHTLVHIYLKLWKGYFFIPKKLDNLNRELTMFLITHSMEFSSINKKIDMFEKMFEKERSFKDDFYEIMSLYTLYMKRLEKSLKSIPKSVRVKYGILDRNRHLDLSDHFKETLSRCR